MMNNEGIYKYQFESLFNKAKEVIGRPAIYYPQNEIDQEIERESKESRLLFDIGGPDFSRFKVFESDYRYWVEVYIIKIVEKLLDQSSIPFEERYFGDDNEQYALVLTVNNKRIAAYFLFDVSYQEANRTDYDLIGKTLKEKTGDVDCVRIYVFRNMINDFTLASLINSSNERNENGFLQVLTLRNFFDELWGTNEYLSFLQYAENFAIRVKSIIGYKTVVTPTQSTLKVFKAKKKKMLMEMDYKTVADKKIFGMLSTDDFERINNNYFSRSMYNALLSSNDYSDSFLSAEWAFDVYSNAMGELELTGIISGYLKSIEQLLYRIARFHRDEGLTIKTNEGYQPYTLDNEGIIDSTLGSLKSFVFSPNARLAISRDIRIYIQEAVKIWTKYQRNGYFHKDNLFHSDNKIEAVREQTIYLYFLILGGLLFTEEQLFELGTRPIGDKCSFAALENTYSLSFKSWLDNTICYDLPAEIPGLWLMLYREDDNWIITAYLMKHFYIDDFENSHLGFDPEIIETNHLRSIPEFKWPAEDDDINTAADHFGTLFNKYRENTSNLDRIGAIILSFGKSTQLIYCREDNKE